MATTDSKRQRRRPGDEVAKPIRREIFVFTIGEKKAAACVLAAILLGLGTKYYREKHPRPSPPPSAREEYAMRKAKRATAARARSARAQKSPKPAATPLPDEEAED